MNMESETGCIGELEGKRKPNKWRHSCSPARQAGTKARGLSGRRGGSLAVRLLGAPVWPLRGHGDRNVAVPWLGISLLLGVLCFGFASPAFSADWPNWRGPARNGVSPEMGLSFDWPAAGPKVLWKANVGTGFSSKAIAGGRLFTMGNENDKDSVRCLDAATGKLVWKHEYETPLDPNLFEGGPTSTPTVDGDRVYTIARQGKVFCFNAADGRVLWSRDLADGGELPAPGWGFAGSPTIHGDQLLLNVGESGMALDKKTGETLWQSPAEESGYTTPVVCQLGGKELGIFSSGKHFSAVDLEDGVVVWSHRWLTRYGVNACDPIVRGDRILIATGYGKGATLVKHAAEEPEEVWKEKVLRPQFANPVLIGDHAYGIDGDENSREPALKCVEFETGKEVWSAPEVGFGSLIAAGDKLVVLSATGELIVGEANPKGWKERARAKVLQGRCWTPPALANGRLHCRNAAGDLVCLDLRKP